jgi:predicted RNA binding protein YcfA (HicA-like mRNA interferase family)
MPKISRIHWKKFEKFLLYVGCEFVREKGDHRVYQKQGLPRPIILPRRKQLELFIIHNNIRLLGISAKEYDLVLKRL